MSDTLKEGGGVQGLADVADEGVTPTWRSCQSAVTSSSSHLRAWMARGEVRVHVCAACAHGRRYHARQNPKLHKLK